MSKLRFDANKPRGTVTPPYNGAVFTQVAADGETYYFNVEGKPVDIQTGDLLEVNVKEPPKEPRTTVVTTVGPGGVISEEVVPDTSPEPKDARTELMKWLRGDEDAETNWMKIRSYGKDVYGRVAPSKEELISFAVDANDIKADQVKA